MTQRKILVWSLTFPVRRKHLRDAAMFNLSSAGEKAGSPPRSGDLNQSKLQFTSRSERVMTLSQSQQTSGDKAEEN